MKYLFIMPLIVLAGCSGGTASKFELAQFNYSPELATCADKPSSKGFTKQSQVAKLVRQQDAVIDDCKGDLEALKKEADVYNNGIEALNRKLKKIRK